MDTITNCINTKEGPDNVFGPNEGLPAYTIFPRRPKLSGRKRPKGRPKKKVINPDPLNNMELTEDDDVGDGGGDEDDGIGFYVPQQNSVDMLENADLHVPDNRSTAIGSEMQIGQEGVTVTPNQCGQGMSVVEQSYLFQVLKAKSVMQICGNTDYLIQDFDTERQMLKRYTQTTGIIR
eukprot:gene2950-biopygen2613